MKERRWALRCWRAISSVPAASLLQMAVWLLPKYGITLSQKSDCSSIFIHSLHLRFDANGLINCCEIEYINELTAPQASASIFSGVEAFISSNTE